MYEIFSTLLASILLARKSPANKDLEILLLRRQLAMAERKTDRSIRPTRSERLTFAALAVQFKKRSGRTVQQLSELLIIVKPAMIIKWHQELVRRKWTYRQVAIGGRPPILRDIEQLIVRLAQENNRGKRRIQGELLKLGYDVSHQTVTNILQKHAIPHLHHSAIAR